VADGTTIQLFVGQTGQPMQMGQPVSHKQ